MATLRTPRATAYTTEHVAALRTPRATAYTTEHVAALRTPRATTTCAAWSPASPPTPGRG
ncbi:hypothetical protein [Microbispora triticiradicis]|uniref:hypothetical protein n=1 Tax=Microbispora triticiradicis TaxID=2200763 RepID=UPI001404CE87|nr:hypothetical protein [Microbispora triticiradicis]